MALPQALQDANEKANELIRQQSEGQKSTPDTGNTEDPKPQAQQPQENRTPEPPQQQQQSDSEQTWEHKYRVLQGKYNADTKKLNEQLQEAQKRSQDPSLQHRLQALESENSQLKQQLEQQRQASQPSGEVKLSQKLVDEYGEDFARAVAEQSSAGSSDLINQLTQKISTLESKLNQTEQATNETADNMRMRELNAELSKHNIDFEQVNTDPMFHDWLSAIDDASGEQRNTLMNNAFQRGDINRTAYFFKAFKAQEGSNFNNNPLSSHVDVTSRAPSDAAGDDNVWTKAQMDKLYADRRAGKLTDAEFQKWEQQLFSAMQQGTYLG